MTVRDGDGERAIERDPAGRRGQLAARVEDLNREMMRLPEEQRRTRWKEYYERLSKLTGQ